jgi:hypothetical protein
MNPMERPVQFVASNGAHECGHMTVLSTLSGNRFSCGNQKDSSA